MKRLHIKVKPLARPVRIALCALAAALLFLAVYAVSGYPAFSPEGALRRAERRALISMRGEILAEVPQMLYNDNQTRFLLVEYGEAAASFYGVAQDAPLKLGWGARGSDVFYLFPKSAGGATVAAYPGYPPFRSFEDELLWIAAFDDFPQAVRAELSFTLVPSDSLGFPDAAPVSYALSSEREYAGIFLFSLAAPEENLENSSTSYVLQRLAECVDPWSAPVRASTFAGGVLPTATVVFYDAAGNAIATVETQFAEALV